LAARLREKKISRRFIECNSSPAVMAPALRHHLRHAQPCTVNNLAHSRPASLPQGDQMSFFGKVAQNGAQPFFV
jgi:hypothetical protein